MQTEVQLPQARLKTGSKLDSGEEGGVQRPVKLEHITLMKQAPAQTLLGVVVEVSSSSNTMEVGRVIGDMGGNEINVSRMM